MTLQELRDLHNLKLKEQETILNAAETRAFTEDENKRFDTLNTEISDVMKQIAEAEKREAVRAQIAASKINSGQAKRTEEEKEVANFSLIKFIREATNGTLTGRELEFHQEAVRESASIGTSIHGFGLPSFMMRAGQDASTAATASNLIATNLDSTLIPALRPRTVLSTLGATSMNGLIGNLDLPAGDGIATATWEGELDAAAQSDPSTRLVQLRPNRLAAYTDISKQLNIQSSFSVEAWIRAEFENAIARAVDSAGIIGNGGNIDGILGTVGVNEITFGGAATRDKLIDLQTKIAVENADFGNLNYLMNPRIKGDLQKLETDSGSGLFVMNNPNTLLGYNVGVSTLVPTNIDSTKTAVIFGNFADLVVANWGGLDITIDPYTLARTGQIRITINSYWDVKLKQPKSFAFGDDITYSALS